MRRLKEGDGRAFEALFQQYWKPLYLAAYKRLQNREESEDIVQELLASVWRRRSEIELNNDEAIGPYLFTALRYRIVSFYAGVKTERFYGDVLQKILEIRDEDQFAHLLTRELRDLLQQEIESMPDKMRQVFVLTREKDLSIRETAGAVGLSEQTVKNLITAASKKLRTRVEQYYNDSSPQTTAILLITFFQSMLS